MEGEVDRYRGVTVTYFPSDFSSGALLLSQSLERWKNEGKRGIWLKIPLAQSEYVPIAAKLGFSFHHAEPNYVMMTRWLPENEPNNLPKYSHTFVGVAGLVINEREEILVVKERFFPNAPWKLPGGLSEIGEDLGAAAMREVLEETGISTEFHVLVCFRHRHDAPFGRGDMYFVAKLKPISTEIHFDPKEIQACSWMPVAEFLSNPTVSVLNREIVQIAALSEVGLQTKTVPSYDGKTSHLLYFPVSSVH